MIYQGKISPARLWLKFEHVRIILFLEIREMLPPAPAAPTIKMADARNRAIARGFTNDQFEEAVEEYEELDVFTVNAARTRLTVVGDN